MRDDNINKNIFRIAQVFIVLFVILLINLSYIQIVKSDWYTNNSLNARIINRENSILRGDIIDSTGKKLVYSEKQNNEIKRMYPYGEICAFPIGYFGKNIGSAGIEQTQNIDLAGLNMTMHKLGPIEQLFEGKKGNTIKLTLDANLQKTAWNAIGQRRGAAVVMDADTGAVLVMASRPAFNPNTINEDWDKLRNDKNSPLINRAAQGLYPPGSSIKPLIADAALQQKIISPDTRINCGPFYDLGNGQKIYEADKATYGNINLDEGLIHSSNVMFAGLAVKLGNKELQQAFSRFGFYDKIKSDFYTQTPHMPDFGKLSTGETAQVGIGQADLLVTPLRMAMLAEAFINQGKIMQPYLVDSVQTLDGVTIRTTSPTLFKEATDVNRAELINSYMADVVKKGTGKNAHVNGIEIAGKTGTAENSQGADHAWFMGTARVKGRNIAFAVILENSGFGGAEAAPIIKQIITTMLRED